MFLSFWVTKEGGSTPETPSTHLGAPLILLLIDLPNFLDQENVKGTLLFWLKKSRWEIHFGIFLMLNVKQEDVEIAIDPAWLRIKPVVSFYYLAFSLTITGNIENKFQYENNRFSFEIESSKCIMCVEGEI